MFKKSAEQQIIIEADKIASMKESIDALSWDRIAEIGKQLQANPSEEERYEMGRELLSISQANTSLLGKLGVAATSFTGKMMPSGVEMLQSGMPVVTLPSGEQAFFAEASLGRENKNQNAQGGDQKDTDESTNLIPDVASDESHFFQAPESSEDNLIPRGDGAAAVTGASGMFMGNEYAPAKPLKVEPVQEPIVTENNDSDISIFDSVLDFSAPDALAEQSLDAQALAAEVEIELPKDTKAHEVDPIEESFPEQLLRKEDKVSKSEEKSTEESFDGQFDPSKTFNLVLDALQNDTLMEELGVEPEIREALIKEVENDLKTGSSKAPVIETVIVEPSLSTKDQGSEVVAVEGKGANKETQKETQNGTDGGASNKKDNNESSSGFSPKVFRGKSESIEEDLERKAKEIKKREKFGKKKSVGKKGSQSKVRKISQKDLANFKQIYESRDGALALYLDSTGHIVAVDSAKLA